MTNEIHQKKSNIFVYYIITLVAVFGLHLSIMDFWLKDKFPLLIVVFHTYLFIVLLVSWYSIKKVRKIDPTKVGMAFLAMSTFKMLFAIGLIFGMMQVFPIDRIIIVAHFFAPFCIYLLLEVLLTLKEIQ